MKLSVLFLSLFLMSAVSVQAEMYQVDAANSNVKWLGTKVTGQHDGAVNVQSGTIKFSDGLLSGGNAVIDMTSLTVADIKDPTYNKKLEDHLKNDDFFGVDAHPTASLQIKDVASLGDGKYDVTGEFTIKGKTAPVNFQATVNQQGDSLSAQAMIKIDRTQFDVKYGSGKFFENLGDKLIHDEFTLDVTVTANKS